MSRSLTRLTATTTVKAMDKVVSRGALTCTMCAASPLFMQSRTLTVRTEDFFSKEAVSHARRVSWAPHTTEKKVGAFAKLARSNFNDPVAESFHSEPYFEEEIEAYRAHHRPDVYVYRYNVSPTHLSLRE